MDDVYDPYELYDDETEEPESFPDELALQTNTFYNKDIKEDGGNFNNTKYKPNTIDTKAKIGDTSVISDNRESYMKDAEKKDSKIWPFAAEEQIQSWTIPNCMILLNLPLASTPQNVKDHVAAHADLNVEVVGVDGVFDGTALVMIKPESLTTKTCKKLLDSRMGSRIVIAKKLRKRIYYHFLEKKCGIKVEVFNIATTLSENELWNILAKKMSTTKLNLNMVITPRANGHHDGYGHVYFHTKVEAEEFCRMFHQFKIAGKVLGTTIIKGSVLTVKQLNMENRFDNPKPPPIQHQNTWRVNFCNVASHIEEKELAEIFSTEVKSPVFAMMKNTQSDAHSRSGFLEFQTEEAAKYAVNHRDGCLLGGLEISLKLNFTSNTENGAGDDGNTEPPHHDALIYNDYNEMLSQSRGARCRARVFNLPYKTCESDMITAVNNDGVKGLEGICFLREDGAFTGVAILEFASPELAEQCSKIMKRFAGRLITIKCDIGYDGLAVMGPSAGSRSHKNKQPLLPVPSSSYQEPGLHQMSRKQFHMNEPPSMHNPSSSYQQPTLHQMSKEQPHINQPPSMTNPPSSYQQPALQQQFETPKPGPSSVLHKEPAIEPREHNLFGLSKPFLDSLNIELPLLKKLLVLNLDFSISEEDLNELFNISGTIIEIQYNCMKGQAIVEMSSEVEAVQSISMFNSQDYFDKIITVRMLRDNDPDDQITKKTAPVIPRGLKSMGRGLGIEGRPMDKFVTPAQSTVGQPVAVPSSSKTPMGQMVQSNDNPNFNIRSGQHHSMFESNSYQGQKQNDFVTKNRNAMNLTQNALNSGNGNPKQGIFSTKARSGGFGSVNDNMNKQHYQDYNPNYNATNKRMKFSYAGP